MFSKVDEFPPVEAKIPAEAPAGEASAQPPAPVRDTCADQCPADMYPAWNATDYGDEQVRGFIEQIFFPGWPKPCHQVVLCAADQHTDTAEICARIARSMAAVLPGTACAIEANLHSPAVEWAFSDPPTLGPGTPSSGSLHVARNLWVIPARSLADDGRLSVVGLRLRLSELRRRFDYAVIHAPAAAYIDETILLGQLTDGVILVLRAGLTHRSVARRTQHILRAAGVPILGAVLIDRTFPIPERLYRKL